MDPDISIFRPDNALGNVERIYDPRKHRLGRLADKLSLFFLGNRDELLASSSYTVTWAAFGLGGNGLAIKLEARVYLSWGMISREGQRFASRDLKRHLSRSDTLFKADYGLCPVVLSCMPCELCKPLNNTSTPPTNPAVGDVREKAQAPSDYQKAIRRLRQSERRRSERQNVRTQRIEKEARPPASNEDPKPSLEKNVRVSDEPLVLLVKLYSRLIQSKEVGVQPPELQKLLLRYLECREIGPNDWTTPSTLSEDANSNKVNRLPLLQKKLQCIIKWWQGNFTATLREFLTEESKKKNDDRKKENGEREKTDEMENIGKDGAVLVWDRIQDAYHELSIAKRAEKMSERVCRVLDDALI